MTSSGGFRRRSRVLKMLGWEVVGGREETGEGGIKEICFINPEPASKACVSKDEVRTCPYY